MIKDARWTRKHDSTPISCWRCETPIIGEIACHRDLVDGKTIYSHRCCEMDPADLIYEDTSARIRSALRDLNAPEMVIETLLEDFVDNFEWTFFKPTQAEIETRLIEYLGYVSASEQEDAIVKTVTTCLVDAIAEDDNRIQEEDNGTIESMIDYLGAGYTSLPWLLINDYPRFVTPILDRYGSSPHGSPEWMVAELVRQFVAGCTEQDVRSALAATAQARDDASAGLVKRLADSILATEHFAQDVSGVLFHFRDGVYRPHGNQYVASCVKALLEDWKLSKHWSSHRAREVAEYIRVDAPKLWERPPIDRINVLNGILNVWTRELTPHSPGWLTAVQLPATFDPQAQCPHLERFIAQVFPEDGQDIAWEIVADLMTPERSRQHAMLLIGEGANGKSTYLNVVGRFIGRENVTSLSLHTLESDRFAAAGLLGKLANICPDLPSKLLGESSTFKAITGGDRIAAERKYRDAFEFTSFARLVFSANALPRSDDATFAFFRRWVVVPFERTFEPGQADYIPGDVLLAQLTDACERSGLLNKALDALPRLRKHGFTSGRSMRHAWQEFREMTDPLAVWLDQHTRPAADKVIAKDDLLRAYNAACRAAQRPTMTSTAFSLAFKRLKPDVGTRQRTIDGKLCWVWTGIAKRYEDGDNPQDPTN